MCDLYDSFLNFNFLRKLKVKSRRNGIILIIQLYLSEEQLLKIDTILTKNEIFARRYFFPNLSTLPYVNNTNDVHVSEEIAERILCLPLYYGLSEEDVNKIVNLINLNLCN